MKTDVMLNYVKHKQYENNSELLRKLKLNKECNLWYLIEPYYYQAMKNGSLHNGFKQTVMRRVFQAKLVSRRLLTPYLYPFPSYPILLFTSSSYIQKGRNIRAESLISSDYMYDKGRVIYFNDEATFNNPKVRKQVLNKGNTNAVEHFLNDTLPDKSD